jgi:orotidine-5'-phosphate decarboxylase
MSHAIEKFRTRARAVNSLLCIGLDSDPAKIPAVFNGNVLAFNRWIIDETAHLACAYKPNSAFYEARGAAGWRDLHETVQYIRGKYPDIFTICDAKRGDFANTNGYYAGAIFDDMGFDAITLHPYLGQEALTPFLERDDKASIILCRTSNPGARELQDLTVENVPLWAHIARTVSGWWNERENCMLVVGATYPDELRMVREIVGEMPILMPGIGAQGGDVQAAVSAGVDSHGGNLLVSASRSILYDVDPGSAARSLHAEINRYR